jgi:hypothetical protein
MEYRSGSSGRDLIEAHAHSGLFCRKRCVKQILLHLS